jgi:uncharacterized membrane protein
MTDATKRKNKAYVGYTSFLVVVFLIVWFAPYDGWMLWVGLVAGIPFSIWVFAMTNEYEKKSGEN